MSPPKSPISTFAPCARFLNEGLLLHVVVECVDDGRIWRLFEYYSYYHYRDGK